MFNLNVVSFSQKIDAVNFEKPPIKETKKLQRVVLENLLRGYATKLGCQFTVEFQGDETGQQKSKIYLHNYISISDFSADSIPSLVSNLNNCLDGFVIVQDQKKPTIVHIINRALIEDSNYILNKKISIKYSGRLEPTNVPDKNRPGYVIPVGGFMAAITEKSGRILEGPLDGGRVPIIWPYRQIDYYLSVDAKDEPLRNLLTDCLSANTNAIIWGSTISNLSGVDGKDWVIVQLSFFDLK